MSASKARRRSWNLTDLASYALGTVLYIWLIVLGITH
jgi:hypothetical protein